MFGFAGIAGLSALAPSLKGGSSNETDRKLVPAAPPPTKTGGGFSIMPVKPVTPVTITDAPARSSAPDIISVPSDNRYQGNSGADLSETAPTADGSGATTALPFSLLVGGSIASLMVIMGKDITK